MSAIHAAQTSAAKRKNVMTPNQSSALAPPRGTDSSSATPRIASGSSRGSALTSRDSAKSESVTRKATKAASANAMALRVPSILRERHTDQAASGHAGHAYHGRSFTK